MTSAVFKGLTSIGDALLGRGRHAVTVPPMDGALQPNQALEGARCVLQLAQPDNLAAAGEAVYVSSAQSLYRWRPGSNLGSPLQAFRADITSLATSTSGDVAVATDDGCIELFSGKWAGRLIKQIGEYRAHCPTAMLWLGDDHLIVAEGSVRHPCSGWRHSLMSRDQSGSVWLIDLKQSSARRLADSLAYPAGLAMHASGDLVVSEGWRHRLLRLPVDGRGPATLVADLPGYPGRLTVANGGGFWLCLFAPRSQLVEFVLREPKFLSRMMTEVQEGYWVAPALSSGRDFKEPLQGGAIKSMGILKPWAPTRSYGLVVRLDAELAPVSSMHSRADGRRHGVTSVLEWQGELLIASRGGGEVVAAPTC